MAHLLGRLWSYINSWGNAKFDEKADPKIQIQQALEKEQKQHQALAQQAAAVIGQQHQLEMKLNRQLKSVDELQENTRQALLLAEQAKSHGDNAKAEQFTLAAENFATQLSTTEAGIDDLKNLLANAKQASEQARQAVERSSYQLQTTLNERTKLVNQLEQAKMQEEVGKTLSRVNGMMSDSNAPNFGEIRDKIEARYAQSSAQIDLARNSLQGQLDQVKMSTAQFQGKKRLEEIKNQMRIESSSENAHNELRNEP